MRTPARRTEIWTSARARLCGVLALPMLALSIAGCQSTPSSVPVADAKVVRYSDAGSELFAEGDTDEAAEAFRKAIRRAWAIDDAVEAGTNAYNLAACLASDGKTTEAKDWLFEARAQLCRGGESAGNTYLLEAKLLQEQGLIAEATMAIDQAACADPPCPGGDGCGCLRCCQDDPCRECCVTKIPCVGSRIKQRAAKRDCEDGYAAQIELARARLAAERYDVDCAKAHFGIACELAADVCSEDLAAELQDVAALIHLAKGEYYQAAVHLDREAAHLQRAGNFREIPRVLELAASAYAEVDRFDLAAERMSRVARIWFGRGSLQKSWGYLQDALRWADLTLGSTGHAVSPTQIRLAILAREIERTLAKNGSSLATLAGPDIML